jgi:hypothetical protein
MDQVTPPLTGHQPHSAEPHCTTRLPALNNIPCSEPATWHIRWAPGAPDDETFPAGLACDLHMAQIARAHAWYGRHPAGPACSSSTARWQDDRCTT